MEAASDKACCDAGKDVSTQLLGAGGGREMRIGGLDCYVAGSGPTCYIVGYDIFGFKVANTRSNVNTWAALLPGTFVVMPARPRVALREPFRSARRDAALRRTSYSERV